MNTNVRWCSILESMEYNKVDPAEEINVGDVIMLDKESALVMKAKAENELDMVINSRLTLGICIDSDNDSILNKIIDGGSAKEEPRIELLDLENLIIDGGNSETNPREIITVAYTGEHILNIEGKYKLGDKVCISRTPGYVRAVNYFDDFYKLERTIGKIISTTTDRNKVKVLLDIE